MAIVNAGTANELSENDVPAGYSRPSVTKFTDWTYKQTLSLLVLKATVHNSDPKVTMANIISNGTIGITKQIDDIIAADMNASETVKHYKDWTNISNNFSNVNGAGDYLTDTAASYQVTVTTYIKSV